MEEEEKDLNGAADLHTKGHARHSAIFTAKSYEKQLTDVIALLNKGDWS